MLALLGALASAGGPLPDAARGQRLFHGEEPLPARIAGQDFALPAAAGRCSNCHGAQAPQRIAPLLSAAALTQHSARRGGPPSRYDVDAFCRLLRSGVDPAYVIVDRAMPRYDLSRTDCEALWRYVTTHRS